MMENQELERLELRISKLLRYGVLIVGAILILGWMGLLLNSSQSLADAKVYKAQSLSEQIWWALLTKDISLLICYVGLAILIALPLTRVLLTGFLFLKQKDKPMAWLAFIVFTTLIASFFLGIEL